MRIGFGYDSHRLVEGRRLVLGGVEIRSERGFLGHSDADVLLHALCDAMLGAIGEGDIGRHFPDTDPSYKDVSSRELLVRVREMAVQKGYSVAGIDSTVVLERPKISEYIPAMISNIAESLEMDPSLVNVKASTNEGMGFIGRGEGAAAFAVVIMEAHEL